MADPGYYSTGGALIADPNNSTVYWSGGDHSNGTAIAMSVSKTTNSGTNWSRTDIASLIGRTEALAVDYSNSDIVYAGGNENSLATIYNTTNGGNSWSKLTATGLSGTVVYDLAVDPDNTNIMYAGTSSGLYKSTDAGQNWLDSGMPGGRTNAVLVNVGSATYDGIYAGTYSNGVYWSTDSGATWMQINDGLLDLEIHCLSVSQSAYIYAGTESGGIHRWSIQPGVEEKEKVFGEKFAFFAQPNPTTGRTVINYQVTSETQVNLSIYDVQGRLIKVLVNDTEHAGAHGVAWSGLDAKNNRVAAGVYFCKLTIEEATHIQKLILLK